jgi:hypothetical protein
MTSCRKRRLAFLLALRTRIAWHSLSASKTVAGATTPQRQRARDHQYNHNTCDATHTIMMDPGGLAGFDGDPRNARQPGLIVDENRKATTLGSLIEAALPGAIAQPTSEVEGREERPNLPRSMKRCL